MPQLHGTMGSQVTGNWAGAQIEPASFQSFTYGEVYGEYVMPTSMNNSGFTPGFVPNAVEFRWR
jgi:hypothetical protein